MTDRARLVIAIANRRSVDLGATSVAPEHLLFALAAEGNNIGWAVLRDLGADCSLVQSAFQAGRIAKLDDFRNQIPFDEASQHVILHAAKEAASLNHGYLGPEHLMMGLATAAVGTIEDNGLVPAELRREVLLILGHDVE